MFSEERGPLTTREIRKTSDGMKMSTNTIRKEVNISTEFKNE